MDLMIAATLTRTAFGIGAPRTVIAAKVRFERGQGKPWGEKGEFFLFKKLLS